MSEAPENIASFAAARSIKRLDGAMQRTEKGAPLPTLANAIASCATIRSFSALLASMNSLAASCSSRPHHPLTFSRAASRSLPSRLGCRRHRADPGVYPAGLAFTARERSSQGCHHCQRLASSVSSCAGLAGLAVMGWQAAHGLMGH